MKRWTYLIILVIFIIISINICVIQSTQCFRYKNPRKQNVVVKTNCDSPNLVDRDLVKRLFRKPSKTTHQAHLTKPTTSPDTSSNSGKKHKHHRYDDDDDDITNTTTKNITTNTTNTNDTTNFVDPIIEDILESNKNNFFIFSISCQSDDSKLCGKVIETIQEAGSILSSVLVLKTPVYVNLSVYDFCADDPLCNGDYAFDPGYAQPTLLYLLRDDDGVERLYPQSLAKQFNSSFNPGFNSPDIYGEFNLALNYWFKNDPPIEYNQYDFLGLVLHEMCHGLGFQTSWSTWSPDDSPQYITPMLMTVEDYEYLWEDNYDPNKQVTWIGFREYIFDKYLVFTKSGQYVSSKTAALNEFFNNNDVIKGSYYDFQQKFISSPQYAIAKEMMNISTQPQTLGLVNWNLTSYHNTSTQGPFNISDLFVVDTSNAFDPYNSINHVDYTIYTNTSDFLMRFQIFPGETVKGDIKLGGKFPKGQLTGAIGPKLRRFFETIGYTTYSRPYLTYTPILDLSPISSGISLAPSLILVFQHVIGLLFLYIIKVY
ncbi:hypothetical protein C2G38_2099001 [Gigaspora rosea]|uniref:Sequence orphan n=1 Tax=Gigaspora rosea TaxID=44941 RepID=A0A397V003_9GLOM|nr:hypothetical protein C2G38_2099001 [Gigaspora rosea]